MAISVHPQRWALPLALLMASAAVSTFAANSSGEVINDPSRLESQQRDADAGQDSADGGEDEMQPGSADDGCTTIYVDGCRGVDAGARAPFPAALALFAIAALARRVSRRRSANRSR